MPRYKGKAYTHDIGGDPGDERGLRRRAEDYLEDLLVKGYSPNTCQTRRFHFALFIRWCHERALIRPEHITKPILERYQRYLFHYRSEQGKPLSFRNQKGQLSTLRSFFRWLCRKNFILYNPASELELPRTPQQLPRVVLSSTEVEKILALPDITTPVGLRDRAMLEVFYATGIRRTELAHLKVYDSDFERQTLFVREGKGRRDRIVPLGERAAAWVRKYLDEARPRLVREPDDGSLFLSITGEGFVLHAVGGIVADYITAADLGKRGSCHVFRHTMATLMLENGADIRFVQAMLGHVQLSTTQIYTHVAISKLQQVHTATHPGARLQHAQSKSHAAAEPETDPLLTSNPHTTINNNQQETPPPKSQSK